MSHRYHKKKRLDIGLWALIILLVICLAGAGILLWQTGIFSPTFIEPITSSDSGSSDPVSVSTVASDPEPSTEPSTEAPDPFEGYQLIERTREQVHQGDLILVNYANDYRYDEEPDNMVPFYNVKNNAYMVKNTEVPAKTYAVEAFNQLMKDFHNAKNLTTVMVISGFRSVEYQRGLYERDLARTGLDYSDEVAVPGQSEHHTGLAIDVTLIIDGKNYSYDGTGEYSYINEHCDEYGLIIRYPNDKTDITKIIYEPWHFRYLGRVHAKAISETDLCYEEYIDKLRDYTYDGEHLIVPLEVDRVFHNLNELTTGEKLDVTQTVTFESYFVPAEEEGNTLIPVPENVKGYDISGNNVDGFIVTIW